MTEKLVGGHFRDTIWQTWWVSISLNRRSAVLENDGIFKK